MINLFGDEVDPHAPPRDLEKEDLANEFHIYHEPNLYDWVKSVKTSKEDLRTSYAISHRGTGKNKECVNTKPDPTLKSLNMFSLLNALMQSEITAPFAHMMNERPYLGKEHQYLFLLHAIPPHESYDKWVKKTNDKILAEIKTVMHCSDTKAQEMREIYNDVELRTILKELKESN